MTVVRKQPSQHPHSTLGTFIGTHATEIRLSRHKHPKYLFTTRVVGTVVPQQPSNTLWNPNQIPPHNNLYQRKCGLGWGFTLGRGYLAGRGNLTTHFWEPLEIGTPTLWIFQVRIVFLVVWTAWFGWSVFPMLSTALCLSGHLKRTHLS